MFSAAIRVVARAAAIQLEEIAAASSRPALIKGKEKAHPASQSVQPSAQRAATADRRSEGQLIDAGDPVRPPRIASVFTSQSSGSAHAEVDRSAHLNPILNEVGDKIVGGTDNTTSRSIQGSTSSILTTGDREIPSSASPSSRASLPTSLDQPIAGPSQPATSSPSHEVQHHQTPSPTSPLSDIPSHIPSAAASPPINDVSPLSPGVLPASEEEEIPVVLRASTVPSSRIGRLFHYGSLAASLSWGAASESLKRTTGGTDAKGSIFMSDANIRRLVSTLGRMRGAALKLGQFMSIQDNHMLPPEIERVLQQVQAHANHMPDWQMEQQMRSELGPEWQSLFSTFERTPIASASIGQVHRGTLAEDGIPVAVKIQFPGIASSIQSDLSNLSLLLRGSAVLPRGLYLQNTIAVMKRELEDECDYVLEAEAGRRFREYLKGDTFFRVPKVVDAASTGKVLTVEWMEGKPLSQMKGLSQDTRNKIGENILRLCLMELFHFRFMQTDPNWANFLYDPKSDTLGLIDFGASREYTKEFMDGWYRLIKSALEGDRVTMKTESEKLGYLTGDENEVMVEAHLDSMALVASPFSHPGPYAFANQSITSSIRSLIPVMLQHRLTPPPQETYSLNRKLSGAFLMCAKLGAEVDCQKLWRDVVGGYQEG